MQPLCAEEIGSVEDVRYILSQNLTPWTGGSAGGTPGGLVVTTNSTNADVYPILYFGEEAYGCTPLKGQDAVDLKIMKPGEARYGDELGQWGSFGWKTYHASGILNQNWIVRAEVAATLL
jgi:N4-gp56 family major capsid protein